MRNIGLHLRFKETIAEIIEQALELNLPIFQCFFTDIITKKYRQLNLKTVEAFHIMSKKFKNCYAHGSYLINLADQRDHYILKHELELSKRLGFNYIILHPGVFKPSSQTLEQGLDCIVKNINTIFKYEREVTLVLENTAFGGNVIGGDFAHFDSIFPRLDFPERVRFCVDTAHAYVFGYDLYSLINILKESVIKDFIQLIHLNDSNADGGSKSDNHALFSQGKISLDSLKAVIQDCMCEYIDIIIEMPETSFELKKDILAKVTKM